MLFLSGCHDKNTDADGVPIVTDTQHLRDAKGNTTAIPDIPSRSVFWGHEGIGFRKLFGAIA